jgi:hypothetical protein
MHFIQFNAKQVLCRGVTYKYWVNDATFILCFSYNMVRVYFRYYTYIILPWVLWFSSGPEAYLRWICIDVFVVEVKVSRGTAPFSPNGYGQCGH